MGREIKRVPIDDEAKAIEALRGATACPEHAARRREMEAAELAADDDLPGGWPWIFDEDNPCGRCAALVVEAVAAARIEREAALVAALRAMVEAWRKYPCGTRGCQEVVGPLRCARCDALALAASVGA